MCCRRCSTPRCAGVRFALRCCEGARGGVEVEIGRLASRGAWTLWCDGAEVARGEADRTKAARSWRCMRRPRASRCAAPRVHRGLRARAFGADRLSRAWAAAICRSRGSAGAPSPSPARRGSRGGAELRAHPVLARQGLELGGVRHRLPRPWLRGRSSRGSRAGRHCGSRARRPPIARAVIGAEGGVLRAGKCSSPPKPGEHVVGKAGIGRLRRQRHGSRIRMRVHARPRPAGSGGRSRCASPIRSRGCPRRGSRRRA